MSRKPRLRLSPCHYDVIERDGCDPVSLELFLRCVRPPDARPPWWRDARNLALAFVWLMLVTPIGWSIAIMAILGFILSR